MGLSVSSNFIPKIGNVGCKSAKNVQKKALVAASCVTVPAALRSYVNLSGKASEINNAAIITTSSKDIELKKTENGGYIVEPETQTELIYGKDAINYLNKIDTFDADTQITFPKKTTGTLFIDGKEINVKENSTVLLNKGTNAKVKVNTGYPQIIRTPQEYSWYKKHSGNQQEASLRDKFKELIYYNSHLYNGDFKPEIFSPDKEKSYAIFDKLKNNGLLNQERNGYFRFKKYYDWNYLKEELSQKGFSEDEIKTMESAYKQIRQTKLDTRLTLRSQADFLAPETLAKLKNNGILYNNKEQTEKMFWKVNFESEQHLRDALNGNQIYNEEQEKVVNAWYRDNKIGYDITGLDFINDNAAIYSLDRKLNNWSMEKSCWLTNSIALSSNKNTASIGTSIVQADLKEPTPMSKLRKQEYLHIHPGMKDKSQSEIYLVTSGSAALTVVRDGIPQIKILRQGDLAVIPPNTPHCVNSIMGEYEQVVSQIPSAFQYGLAFKQHYDLPAGYNEHDLEEKAKEQLLDAE